MIKAPLPASSLHMCVIPHSARTHTHRDTCTDSCLRWACVQAGDWWDTVSVPSCTNERDVVNTDFFATVFPPVPVDFNTTDIRLLKDISVDYLTAYNTLQTTPTLDLVGECTDRFSVVHCHVLAHVSLSIEAGGQGREHALPLCSCLSLPVMPESLC
jgi:hypothetical protein